MCRFPCLFCYTSSVFFWLMLLSTLHFISMKVDVVLPLCGVLFSAFQEVCPSFLRDRHLRHLLVLLPFVCSLFSSSTYRLISASLSPSGSKRPNGRYLTTAAIPSIESVYILQTLALSTGSVSCGLDGRPVYKAPSKPPLGFRANTPCLVFWTI